MPKHINLKPRPTTHGGIRQGAGRPAGSGRWGEPCIRMSIPESRAGQVRDFLSALHDKRLTEVENQLPELLIRAGFDLLHPVDLVNQHRKLTTQQRPILTRVSG